MTPEQTCFLQLLRDYVHQCSSDLPLKEINWEKLVEYAREQSLCGILYIQCRGFLTQDSEALEKLHQGFYSAVYDSVNGTVAWKQIREKFEKAGLSYLSFKGEVLRRYYPDPELRTMGDRDVLIHHQDRETADRLIRSLGYEKYVDNHAVWTYSKPNIVFEIHDIMFYEYLSNQIDYREYFGNIWENTIQADDAGAFIPEPNRHFLYLMCHTAKHIINNGMGFRAFLDMVFMVQNERNLKWNWLEGELERLKLLDFTRTCFALCERWFDITMPFSDKKIEEKLFEDITCKTFEDGIFGLHNAQNEAAHSAKEIKRSKQSYLKTALTLSLKKLFPPYEDMQLIPWYGFLDGKPWLLPLGWIYRWWYVGTHKPEHGREYLAEPFEKKDVIEKRKKFLDDWGL